MATTMRSTKETSRSANQKYYQDNNQNYGERAAVKESRGAAQQRSGWLSFEQQQELYAAKAAGIESPQNSANRETQRVATRYAKTQLERERKFGDDAAAKDGNLPVLSPSSSFRRRKLQKVPRRNSAGNRNALLRRKDSRDNRDGIAANPDDSRHNTQHRRSERTSRDSKRFHEDGKLKQFGVKNDADTLLEIPPTTTKLHSQRKPMPLKPTRRTTKTICIDTAKEILASRTSPAVMVFEPSAKKKGGPNETTDQKVGLFGALRRNSVHARAGLTRQAEKPRQVLSKISKEDLKEWLDFAMSQIYDASDVAIDFRSTLSSSDSVYNGEDDDGDEGENGGQEDEIVRTTADDVKTTEAVLTTQIPKKKKKKKRTFVPEARPAVQASAPSSDGEGIAAGASTVNGYSFCVCH
ncbi:hypothetical protein ACA910_016027 [Epithemia clementina (nom. ined.)]